MGVHVDVLLASATMGPPVLAAARQTMHIHLEYSFHLNLGNDLRIGGWLRPSIMGRIAMHLTADAKLQAREAAKHRHTASE